MRNNTEGKPFIEKINLVKIKSKEVDVEIIGNWPNPSWSLKEVQIIWNETEQEVKIDINGIKSRGIAVTMLKPFREIVNIQFPSLDKWVIIVQGKAKELRTQLWLQG